MPKRTPYDSLVLIPAVIADTVCNQVYDGSEFSERAKNHALIEKVEAARKLLTTEQRRTFAELVDALCRKAYEVRADWFEKIVRAKGNSGRDQLYVWVKHWLASYVSDPESLRRMISRTA